MLRDDIVNRKSNINSIWGKATTEMENFSNFPNLLFVYLNFSHSTAFRLHSSDVVARGDENRR